MNLRLLQAFQQTFQRTRYLHRNPSLGDRIAQHLFEDLFALGRSRKLHEGIVAQQLVLNARNLATGVKARRGDGILGDRIGTECLTDPGFAVARGHTANIHVGVEVKILAKAMIKQIDRVLNDLSHQAAEFRKSERKAIAVAIIGINSAEHYTSYEGRRVWKTDGKEHPHPVQEAPKAELRITTEAKPRFDELLTLRFRAPNEKPYLFEWVNWDATSLEYEAALVRISREYDLRFP